MSSKNDWYTAMWSREGCPSAKSVSLPLAGHFLAHSNAAFYTLCTSGEGFLLKHAIFLSFLPGVTAPFGATTYLMACLDVLNLEDLIGFLTILLSRQDLLVAMGIRGNILLWFSWAPGSFCVMGYNSGGCNFSSGWAMS